MGRPAAAYSQPGNTEPSGARKRDPKQEAAGREEARTESRRALAQERAQRLAEGQTDADVPAGTDVAWVAGQIACKRSIPTIAREIGCGADKLAAWLLHPDRRETYNAGLLGFAHNCATETIEIADDLTLDAVDKKVMIDARWAAAKTMGREFYADRVQIEAEVRHRHTVDSSALTIGQRDQLRGILRAAIDQAQAIEHESGEE